MRCPRCGAPLTPDGVRLDLYQCDQCGEVEIDEEGAYINGLFFERGGDEGAGDLEDEDDDLDEEYVPTWQEVAQDDLGDEAGDDE